MHSLLNRQIRKKLPARFKDDPDLQDFFNSVDQSYEDFDDKLTMLQRATTISSKELSEANKELFNEAERQKIVLQSLNDAMVSLKLIIGNDQDVEILQDSKIEKLAVHIKKLAIENSKINQEKTDLLKDLEARNESLSNYIQIFSHDLKSPLRNINTLMSWILEEEKEGFSFESKKNCVLVTQNLSKMEQLISGVLDHATIGAAPEHKSEVSIEELIIEVKGDIVIPENVTLNWSATLPTITIEKIWLEKVFYHLIKNAITAVKNNEEGLVYVGYEQDDIYWKFSVSDNGIGIADRYHKSIFEIFKKLENDSTAAGVGLAISKKIVNLYQGDIELSSKEGEGSTFFFSLKKEL
jgi:light-regulated signal transduction histidine kinase (bacteriophytochrome)